MNEVAIGNEQHTNGLFLLMLAIADLTHREACQQLLDGRRSQLGQYMTPAVIARFMVSLFYYTKQVRLLDAGAGTGTLSAAFLDAALQRGINIEVDAWEIDPILHHYLQITFEQYALYEQEKINIHLHLADFIEDASFKVQMGADKLYTHAILNPPYKKINAQSHHRQLLRKVGIETVNLYTSFVALAILLLENGGELVAIIPRSFCNGSYYRPFRELLLKHCAILRIHLFESRSKAFGADDVLQENIIIHLCKGAEQKQVMVSISHDARFDDYQENYFTFVQIVKPDDAEHFIHIPTSHAVTDMPALSQHTLADLEMNVSTGAVVDFRVKDYWSAQPASGTVPLLYPHHFSTGQLIWPKTYKAKPNALHLTPVSRKWLLPNAHYVLVKRFSSKEEKRRIVAYHFKPERFDVDWLGFENHWNVFHCNKNGLDATLAAGLAIFLNSTVLDVWFRVFSGHTQVNATDLRTLRYPSRMQLLTLGELANSHASPNQQTIDQWVANLL